MELCDLTVGLPDVSPSMIMSDTILITVPSITINFVFQHQLLQQMVTNKIPHHVHLFLQ